MTQENNKPVHVRMDVRKLKPEPETNLPSLSKAKLEKLIEEAVVDAYDTGGVDRPSRSEFIHPLGLSLAEKQDLVAFLRTLTGDPAPFALPALPR